MVAPRATVRYAVPTAEKLSGGDGWHLPIPWTQLFERTLEESVITPNVDPYPPRFYVSLAVAWGG